MFRTFSTYLLISLLSVNYSLAEGEPKRLTRSEYIDSWKDEAIKQMREHGIPASITLAQGILESGDGNSELARDANNHFGIKCHDWTGKKIYKDDDKRHECFRKYGTAHESFEDHSIFLKRTRYSFLYNYEVTDYKAWARGLKQAGYATNPSYPALLIRIIEENKLDEFDVQALSKNYNPKRPTPAATSGRTKSNSEITVTLGRNQEVFLSDNNVKYIIAKTATNARDVANEMDMGRWQVMKYNDLDKRETIEAGSKIYLQPKRNKSKKYKTHTVATGETVRIVSQLYGVKIKKILKYSDLPSDYKAKPGDVLKLRR